MGTETLGIRRQIIKQIEQKQNTVILDVHLEKQGISDETLWSSEVAVALIEYANMIIKGNAGREAAEKFISKNGVEITAVAAELIGGDYRQALLNIPIICKDKIVNNY